MRNVIAPIVIVFVLLALLSVGAILLRRLGRRSGAQRVEASYEALPALLTPAERSFFGVLRQALASDYQIFAKVRLADIVQPVRNSSRSGWQSAFNRIAGKHVDFVLCDSADLGIVGVIELDDSTHGTFERGVRDMLVDSALADARIPILRVPARQSYSPAELRQQVENLCRSDKRVSKKAP
jgi:hypothetical protein